VKQLKQDWEDVYCTFYIFYIKGALALFVLVSGYVC